MSSQAPGWVVPIMRAGYAGRGIVYSIVGGLAVAAGWSGGQAQGTAGALATMEREPWGQALLILVALGMFAYAVWRAMDCLMDLENYGTDGEGLVARAGMIVTGAIHLALGVYVVSLLRGPGGGGSSSGGGGGGTAQDVTAMLLQQDYGRWLVIAAGVVTIGAAIYYAHKGIAKKFKEKIRRTQTTEQLEPILRLGLIAHGVVVAVIGVFLIVAAWTYDPSKAGGLGQAFDTIREQPYGRWLLLAVARGRVFFAVFCFVNAIWRIVPRAVGDDDVATLASEAERKVRSTGRRVSSAVR